MFGRDLDLVRSLQIVAGAAAAALLVGTGARLFGSLRAGVLAGVLLALYPMAVFYDGQVEKTSLGLLALCVALRLAVTGDARRRLASLACGVALGALGLLRENALALLPVLAAWLALGPGARPRQARALDVVALGAGLLLALSPVAVHNATRGGGGPLPTTFQLGVNLYLGNGRGADGTYRPLGFGGGTWQRERDLAVSLAERDVGRALTPAEVSSYWLRRTLDDVRREPAAWARLMATKWLLCWNDGEPIDSESQEAYADESHVLRGLLQVLPFSIVFALAVWGAVATWPRRRRVWLVHAAVLALTAALALFFVFARYRLFLLPPLLLLAGAGLHALRGPWTWPRAGALAASLAAGLLVARAPEGAAPAPDAARAVTFHNLGVAVGQAGRFDDAALLLAHASRLAPDQPETLGSLGEALFRARRLDESEAVDARALELLPVDAGASRTRIEWRLGLARVLLGRPGDALAPLEAARARAPDDPEVLRALALAYDRLGRRDEAKALVADAVRLEAR